jgi:hypothetical protein
MNLSLFPSSRFPFELPELETIPMFLSEHIYTPIVLDYNGISYIPELMWSAPDTVLSTEACLNGLGGVNLHWSL